MKKIIKILAFFGIFASFCFYFQPKTTSFAITKNLKDNQTAKMSIVIDDFGSYDQSGVDILSKVKVPLTCAIIPKVDNSKENAKLMSENGHEIILHMPMEAHVNLPISWYGPVFIRNTDSAETANNKLEDCLKDFPEIKGFNVHIGSGVTRNKQLMTAIYDFAKKHNLYFLDSRTIETKATEEASSATDSIYLGRDVFLEADKNRSYSGVCKRLIEGANIAKTKGHSIVIGHVGAEGGINTAKAIVDTLEKIEKMGVKIVPLSEIYEDMKTEKHVVAKP